MTWRRTLGVATACLCLAGSAAARDDQRDGLVKLNRQMLALLEKVEEKLARDEPELAEGWAKIQESAATAIESGALARSQFNRAALAPRLRTAWKDENIRKAVLFSLAQVDLAVDAVGEAQLEELRQLELARQQSLRNLIVLIGRLKDSQKELLTYFEDPSARKRLGELNAGLIATALVEARSLRDQTELSNEDRAALIQDLEARLSKSIQLLQEFLGRIQ